MYHRRIDLAALLHWAVKNDKQLAARAFANAIIAGIKLDNAAAWS